MMRRSQSGNIFFALFGAVGLVAVLGAATMTIMKGPVRSMAEVTKRTVAENAMIAAGRLALSAATQGVDGGDCDGDGYVEPIEWSETGTGIAPVGGGFIPPTIGAAQQDSWGTTYGYCAWDHGSAVDDAGCGGATQLRLAGEESENYAAIAVISAGANRTFETTCGDTPDYLTRVGGSDDIILEYTYGESSAMGLWRLKSGDPDTAEIGARDIEIAGSGGAGSARIGYDADLDMAGVGDFLAIKTDSIYSKTPSGTVGMYAPLRVQNVISLGAPATGGGGFAALQCTGDEIPVWDDDLARWTCGVGDGDSLGDLSCNSNEYPRWNGTAWECTAISDSDLLAGLSCSNGQVAKWNGSAWACASDNSGSSVWSLNGAKAYYNSGNVGIGTNDPQQKLSVVGNILTTAELISTSANQLRAISGNYGFLLRNDGTNTYMLLTASGDQYGSWNALRPFIINDATGDVSLGNSNLHVLHSGNVGIGTTSPNYKLHVVGNTKVDGTADFVLSAGSTSSRTVRVGYEDANNYFRILAYGSAHATLPNRLLLDNTAAGSNATGGYIDFRPEGNFMAIYPSGAASGSLRLYSGGTESMRLAANGDVGIGTTSPSYKLHVEGDAGVSGGNQLIARYNTTEDYRTTMGWNALQLGNNSTNYIIGGRTATGGSIRFVVNNTNSYKYGVTAHNGYEALIINSNGTVGVNMVPNYQFDVNGIGRATQWRWMDTASSGIGLCQSSGSGTYVVVLCSSLRKYKENIRDMTLGWDELMKLRPVEYKWKEDHGGYEDIGFIAEEVHEVHPVLNSYDDGKLLGVKYEQLTALLTKGIQELKRVVDDLIDKVAQLFDITTQHEKRIAALEGENRVLRARLDDIESTLAREAR